MLPEILAGSYKRYKEDTNVFATWLSKTAKACGYKPPVPKNLEKTATNTSKVNTPASQGARLKGKARKEAKLAAESNGEPSRDSTQDNVPVTRYTMRTVDLLEQAKVVANCTKPRIQIPLNILRVVQRAIQARQRCAAWFHKTGAKKDNSTEGHAHFISVLEKALAILESCCTAKDKKLGGSMHEQKVKHSVSADTDGDSLSNRFNMLDVEDTNDAVLDVAASDITAAKKSPTSTAQSANDIYELEIMYAADLSFIVYCFFEDMHRIQDFLKETWKKYNTGALDLMTATITTNAAFDLTRRAEDDIILIAPDVLTKPRSYERISLLIFYADSFSKGDDPEARTKSDFLKITPFDEFIYLSTARTLIKFEQLASMKIAYPQPVPECRISYVSRPELLELPEVKKWEVEDRRLSQFLMDMTFYDTYRDAMGHVRQQDALVEDELSSGLLKLRKEGEISAWVVFASRVLLDIQEILGRAAGEAYKELRDAGATASSILDLKVEGHVLTPGASGERWIEKDGKLIMKINEMLRIWIIDSPFLTLKRRWLAEKGPLGNPFHPMEELDPETRHFLKQSLRAKGRDVETNPPQYILDNAKKIGIRPIEPAVDDSFIYTQNPLYCGTLSFNLAANMEEAGITLSNHHLVIFAVSHIYNALQQTGILNAQWPDMDRIIKLHIKPLFNGQLPTTPKDFHTRFCLRLGFSPRNFAPNQRAPRSIIRTPGNRDGPKIAGTPTSNIFREYFDGKAEMKDCLYRLEALEPAESRKKWAARRHLTPLEFLVQMRDLLPRTLPDMRIDYISMTRTCNMLLKRIRSRIHEKLDILHKLTDHEDSNNPGFIIMLLAILGEASKVRFWKDELTKGRVSLPEGPQLEICGEIMQAFLEETAVINAEDSSAVTTATGT